MSKVAEKIAAEIAACGPIPFARFMELALYCPDCGFYEKEKDSLGRQGHYFTSVSVGPLFGRLLAFQFAEWLTAESTAAACPVIIVEAGAHDGKLAGDILDWLSRHRPALISQLSYYIVEPSPRRQEWQRQTLARFGEQVRWGADLAAASEEARGIRGIIFANELLDAFPVHRLGWDARRRVWFEWGVRVEAGQFIWARLADGPEAGKLVALLPELPPGLLEVLPDGFTTEVCPGAVAWWRAAARSLTQGRLLTFDYGLEAAEFFAPERQAGTVRAYRQHRVSEDVLSAPGEQDLTAHVNFTAIRSAGEAEGLKPELAQTQEQFLTRVAARVWGQAHALQSWRAAHTRQFRTLTHPALLGSPFRVLVQARGL